MAEDEQTQVLDPMTVLASKQDALDKRLSEMSEALKAQSAQMGELMKSNAALVAQNNALIAQQNNTKMMEPKAEAVQQTAYDYMMKALRKE